ncbi:Uncharacterised protein [Mycobacteroides abscessus subsp. abscessus]|nr:Uncharacterised protein [Mycobacteroides abscessus subsp. abscessus]
MNSTASSPVFENLDIPSPNMSPRCGPGPQIPARRMSTPTITSRSSSWCPALTMSGPRR